MATVIDESGKEEKMKEEEKTGVKK